MMPHDDLSVAESHQRRDALTRSEARNKKRGLTHKKRHSDYHHLKNTTNPNIQFTTRPVREGHA